MQESNMLIKNLSCLWSRECQVLNESDLHISDIVVNCLIFHLRSTGVSAILYGLQYPLPCTLLPATRKRYCVPLSTVWVCAVVSGLLIMTALLLLPSLPTTSYCTSQERMASRVLSAGGLGEKEKSTEVAV